MMRLKTSRPNKSVPIRCCQEGVAMVVAVVCVGLYGASASANTATRSSSTTMHRPSMAVWLRRSRRRVITSMLLAVTSSCSTLPICPCGGIATVISWRITWILFLYHYLVRRLVILDAWIEKPIQDVHQQVHQHKGKRHKEHEGLHLRIIAQGDGGNAKGAYPRDSKDRLDDNGPTHEETNLQSQYRHGRYESVLEGVFQHHGAFPDTLGTRGGDIIEPNDFHHAG